jgi:hypothetical protein
MKHSTHCIADGIHYGLAATPYHADPALGSTSIKRILESPMAYRWDADHPRTASRAMDVGSLIHAVLLEPHTVGTAFVELDGGQSLAWHTGAFQEWYRGAFGFTGCEGMKIKEATGGFKAHYASQDRTIVRASDMETARNAAAAVRGDALASILVSGDTEVSAVFTDDAGVRLKARCDALPTGGEIDAPRGPTALADVIVDLKTTGKRAHSDEYTRHAIRRMGYGTQLGHYRRVMREAGQAREHAVMVVVEQAPPHHVGIFYLDDETLELGEAQSRKGARDWATCTEAGQWPGYGEGIVSIGLDGDDLERGHEFAKREVLIDVF